jgi:tetratricopeptide (TPR) repeat protein
MKVSSISMLAALATLCSVPAFAQVNDPAYLRTRTQVDGITTKTLDKLWDYSDHYWHEGDYNRIVDLCRIVMEGDPNDEEVCSAAAYLLWSMGDTPAADWLLTYGLKHATKNQSLFYYNTGYHIFVTKRYNEALPYLQKAVALGGVPFSAYSTLGHTYDRLGRLPESVKTWEEAVKRFPAQGAGKTNLARVKAKLAARR